MADCSISSIMTTVESITIALDTDPGSWREHLQAVRGITASLEIQDMQPDESRKPWQLALVGVFQRVAYADADSGGVLDIANWCLRQALALLSVYPEDVNILTLIGRNWLSRAQKYLAIIHVEEQNSSSSGASSSPLSESDRHRQAGRAAMQPEDRIQTANYVEARGILLPATEYLKRAVDTARTQGNLQGSLLCSTAEAYMSLGNVSSTRTNSPHFTQALRLLREADDIPGHTLPEHLQHYLEEYGPLIE